MSCRRGLFYQLSDSRPVEVESVYRLPCGLPCRGIGAREFAMSVFSEQQESHQRSSRWPVALFAAAVWIGANVAVLAWLPSQTEIVPRRHRPAKHVLEAFEDVSSSPSWNAEPGTGADVRLRLMSPSQIEPGKTYPLVLFLHGAGPRGRDNRRHLVEVPERLATAEWRERFPCFLAAPQCPEHTDWTSQIPVLVGLIEHLIEQSPIDRRRIYLTGLSMGGFGSWELAMQRPDLFAAGVPICGGGDPARAAALVDVPFWAVHGDADDVVPLEQSRRMVQAIRQAGGHPRFTILKGVGHDSWTPAYSDTNGVIPWMFQQVNMRDRGADGSPQTIE